MEDLATMMNQHPVMPGIYRGTVLKHLSAGKCKIWVPGVYPDKWNSYEEADNLPSAEQATPLGFGDNEGLGIFSYPNIGATVWVFFQNNDQNLPVYFATSLGGSKAAKQWKQARVKPGSHPNDAYVHKIAVKNSNITIYESGTIKVETTNGSDQTCALTMDDHGNITLESTSTITLKTKQILLDAETQIDAKAPNIQQTAEIRNGIKAPAIELDSSDGHTSIISRGGWSKIF